MARKNRGNTQRKGARSKGKHQKANKTRNKAQASTRQNKWPRTCLQAMAQVAKNGAPSTNQPTHAYTCTCCPTKQVTKALTSPWPMVTCFATEQATSEGGRAAWQFKMRRWQRLQSSKACRWQLQTRAAAQSMSIQSGQSAQTAIQSTRMVIAQWAQHVDRRLQSRAGMGVCRAAAAAAALLLLTGCCCPLLLLLLLLVLLLSLKRRAWHDHTCPAPMRH